MSRCDARSQSTRSGNCVARSMPEFAGLCQAVRGCPVRCRVWPSRCPESERRASMATMPSIGLPDSGRRLVVTEAFCASRERRAPAAAMIPFLVGAGRRAGAPPPRLQAGDDESDNESSLVEARRDKAHRGKTLLDSARDEPSSGAVSRVMLPAMTSPLMRELARAEARTATRAPGG